jgi:cell division protein ZapB
METDNLKKLENRIDDLIGVCRKLKKENHAMKAGHEQLSDDHAKLVEKTQIARARIEAMIGRLKALERGS